MNQSKSKTYSRRRVSMLNLNLGSGTTRKQDYLSVDLYADADLEVDLRNPLPFDNETVDNIYACHVIEHFSRDEWEEIYPDWVRVLKIGGTIEIRCPDIVKSCQQLIDNPNELRSLQILYGLQSHDGEYHKNGFTEQSLTEYFMGFDAEVLEPSTDYELHMRFTK